ncbi:class I SAM-dependent rRNA methyltransferase [Macrococcoides caseolyticum]|uniref:class I SAM-dependent rRNA methyltransferase n=1 Tax=Macrococcoides caseolyticum TaxID=69966 RepID=UPI001F43B1CC|nr:class I SAM-dependent rRNA methyltransferase [Macrococcus caseolyticus]MCE4956934.1 class I SAM-dependent rRNA methyltransferase [Macrococcus caseolyticus]
MKSVILKKNKQEKFKQGYLLLENDDIYQKHDIKEGELFTVQTDTGEHLGTFYCGLQHRGFGWKVSDGYINSLDTSYFMHLFEAAKAYRLSLFNATDTNAFRLYNGEGDGLGGFTIDDYNGHLLIQWYSKGIYQYKHTIVEAIMQVFDYQSIFEKLRYDKNVSTHQITDETVEFPIMILENNLNYMIDLNDGAMTGLFLDQRDVRKKLLKLETKGNALLNLFAYSGGFSVAGATNHYHTTNVDIAKRSIELMTQNFAINDINLDEQTFYTLDAFDALKYFARHLKTFDCIVIDPPSFSRHKKKVFSVKDNYHELIEASVPLVNYNGYLILSTNASNVLLKQFKQMIEETLKPICNYEIESVMGLPKDFKTTDKYKPSKYLKVVTVKILP